MVAVDDANPDCFTGAGGGAVTTGLAGAGADADLDTDEPQPDELDERELDELKLLDERDGALKLLDERELDELKLLDERDEEKPELREAAKASAANPKAKTRTADDAAIRARTWADIQNPQRQGVG